MISEPEDSTDVPTRSVSVAELCRRFGDDRVAAKLDSADGICHIRSQPDALRTICERLGEELGYVFATLVAEEQPDAGWSLLYLFYKDADSPWVHVELQLDASSPTVPSISGLVHGPSVDWHEREVEDLFGLTFEGHPRLGDFILHEDWPEGVNPMRHSFDARQQFQAREIDTHWQPTMVVEAPGVFAMPIGPVYSDFGESAHFRLETVGEDVIRTIPRFFYKYRGIEKIAEGQTVNRTLLISERFTGTAAFAHAVCFCQAVEAICNIQVPPRAQALRTIIAEIERMRHHVATITGICNSTALAIAASQAALIEEELLRLSCEIARHRYFFGLARPGGVACDLSDKACRHLDETVGKLARRLRDLHEMLRYSSSFLDRLEEVGIVTHENAVAYGLVGPIARASGVGRDIRELLPYAAYGAVDFVVPTELECDGYARLRVFFAEAEQSSSIINQLLRGLPEGPVCSADMALCAGNALAAVEAPSGAAFHWLRLTENGMIARYRVTPPSFANWHGFHLAAENFAFQDFPIILASFGLSNAECDR